MIRSRDFLNWRLVIFEIRGGHGGTEAKCLMEYEMKMITFNDHSNVDNADHYDVNKCALPH